MRASRSIPAPVRALLVFAGLAWAAPAAASPVLLDFDAPASPDWAAVSTQGSSAIIDGGLLSLDSMSGYTTYRLSQLSSEWFPRVTAHLGVVVEARIWVERAAVPALPVWNPPCNGSVSLYVDYGNGTDILDFNEDSLCLAHPSYVSYPLDTTDGFHTYRLERAGTRVKIYVDGALVIDQIDLVPWMGSSLLLGLAASANPSGDETRVHVDYLSYDDEPCLDVDGDGTFCGVGCPAGLNAALPDQDADGVADICDNCALSNPDQSDIDKDGIADACDNCLSVPNDRQSDVDGDGIGNACDTTCISVRRGPDQPSSVEDATVARDPSDPSRASTNYGAVGNIETGVAGTTTRKALLWFDLSAVPHEANLISAELTLRKAESHGSGDIFVYTVMDPWDEATATWNTVPSSHDRSPTGYFDVSAVPAGGYVHVYMMEFVQNWIFEPNLGIRLANYGVGRAKFGSSEAPSLASRPRLDVCWVLPD